jgi:hypothetical protein
MRHFFRTHVSPGDVMTEADSFFAELGLRTTAQGERSRTFQGVVGTPEVVASMRLRARAEGGHYTLVEVETDQMGESRLDRNVKRFFVSLHRQDDPRHTLVAAY